MIGAYFLRALFYGSEGKEVEARYYLLISLFLILDIDHNYDLNHPFNHYPLYEYYTDTRFNTPRMTKTMRRILKQKRLRGYLTSNLGKREGR